LLADQRGTLVPPASPAALAGALVELLADPLRRVRMGARAHEFGRAS
jgi:glycosyltransferase involved in cell wall biosynthesis